MIVDSRQEVKRETERGTGLGKILETGFELGTPIVQQHCVSAHLPTRLSTQTQCTFLNMKPKMCFNVRINKDCMKFE